MPTDKTSLYAVRRVVPEDWQAIRRLRLTALGTEPHAFGEPFETAQRRTDDEWQQRVTRNATSDAIAVFLALDGEEPVGMMGVLTEDEEPHVGTLMVFGVWVDPSARGSGVADDLHAACLAFARGTGKDRLTLWVWEDNPRAIAFYRRLGYTETGRTIPHPALPEQVELEMALPL